MAAIQRAQNRAFMALSIRKEALAMQANGGALNQSWNTGQPLTYTIPTANNAFLTGFWVQCKLTGTLASGASAVYGQTAGFPLTLIDSIQVQYGGQQHNFRPYILKYLAQLMGVRAGGQPRPVPVAGQSDAYLDGYYSNFPWGVATGANTWTFSFYVPMNLLHPQDVRGILPIQNGETSCQVIVNCAGAPLGLDPILNAVYPVSGSGHSITMSGTIAVIAEYKDGQTYAQLAALQPNLSGIETLQLMRDAPLNNVTAGQVYRQKISFLKKHAWVIATIVDGVQSNKFAATSNFQIIEATADSTGNRPFFRVGNNTNLDIREFYNDLCGRFGGLLDQDLDEGILPLVIGPIYEQASPDTLEGAAYLDMTIQSGWTDYHYGVQLASVGTASYSGFTAIAPRFETHVVMLNDPLVM